MTPDYANPATNTLIFGGGSSGKTTMAYRVMINLPGVACRFIFDEDGQASHRLGIRPAFTVRECEERLALRWVCFNPYRMFRADQMAEALDWFAGWSYQVSLRGHGTKVFFVDEMWKFQSAKKKPSRNIEKIFRTGRWWHLQFLSATHRPREYHVDLRSLVTEWIGFNTVEEDELKAVKPYFAAVERLAALPRGEFISYFRDTKGEIRGKVF